jgi:tripeptidyl-peptidase-1
MRLPIFLGASVLWQANGTLVAMENDAVPVPAAGWASTGAADPSQMLELQFAVKQTNVAELEATLARVSDPQHDDYGKHLSNDDVHQLVAPSPQSLAALQRFFTSHDVDATALSPNSDWLSVTVPVSVAEQLLSTKYETFKHQDADYLVHRAASYSLPAEVAPHVDFVSPTVHFPPVHQPVPQFDMSPGELGVSASKLRTLYSVGDTVGTAANNKHAVTGFLNQHFHPKDLGEFWSLFMKGVNATKPTVKEVGDEVEGGIAGTESMLDIEYINAMGAGIESEFWGFSGNSPDNPQNEPFIKWLAVVSNTSDADVPLIFSTSYGEEEDSTTMDTATRTNVEFMKAGARGISLLFASGDSGAAPGQGGCVDNKFSPKWPAGSPYVTAVGGTSGTSPESAAGLSSGGLCNRWATPSWQTDAVHNYLTTAQGVPPASYYNASGRGFPDISAQAMGFTVVANLIPVPGVAGTSCASPTASGVMALLNDVRLAAGKPSLGFLNPFIYQNAAAFNDITTGKGEGCGIGQSGFPASSGWDPVTGVGTPNYEQLSAIVKNLP